MDDLAREANTHAADRLSLNSSASHQTLLLRAILFAITYFTAAELGHYLSFPTKPEFATFWPPNGILMAVLAILPRRQWLVYALAAVLANFASDCGLHERLPLISFSFCLTNLLECLFGAWTMQTVVGHALRLEKLTDVLALSCLGGLFSPMLGATLGAGLLTWNALDNHYWHLWYFWWLSDAVGILVTAPLVVAWLKPADGIYRFSGRQALELAGIVLGTVATSALAFGPWPGVDSSLLSFPLLTFPLLLLAGLRTGQRGAALASFLASIAAVWGTTRGFGMYAREGMVIEVRAGVLQFYLIVISVVPLLFAVLQSRQRATQTLLSNNLKLLKAIMDGTTDVVFVKDLAGRYLLINRAGAAAVGKPAAAIVGLSDLDLFEPEGAEKARMLDRQVITSGMPTTYEQQGVKQSADRSYLITKGPYRDDDGEIQGVIGIAHDVSPLKRAAETVAASAQRFRMLAALSPTGIFEYDNAGNNIYVNQRCCDIYEMTEEQLLRSEGWSLVHPEDLPRITEAWRHFTATGHVDYEVEFRLRWPDGRLKHVLAAAVPLVDEMGETRGFIGNILDLTSRKAAEAALRESEQRFRQLAESISEVFWLREINPFRILYINPAYEASSGRTCASVYADGLSFLEGVHPDDRERILKDLPEQERGPFVEEFRIVRPNGDIRWIQARHSPVRDSAGNVVRIAGVASDITEQRAAREVLRQTNEDLERRVAQRTQALLHTNDQLRHEMQERLRSEERLREQQAQLAHALRLSTLGEMAAELAHEVNQPLSAITNYVRGTQRRMQAGNISLEEVLTTLETIGGEAQRAAEIIRRTKRFVASQPQSRAPLNLKQLVGEALAMLDHEVRERNVQVVLDLESLDSRPVLGDGLQILQVIVNLLRNALESLEARTDGDCRIELSIRADDDRVELSLSDNGAGLPETSEERIFEAFYTTKTEGLGLGLPISRSIIEAHGGRLWSERAKHGGAIFRFTLPIREQEITHVQAPA